MVDGVQIRWHGSDQVAPCPAVGEEVLEQPGQAELPEVVSISGAVTPIAATAHNRRRL
ncbi:MAG TPA: hypothetical protein VMW80_02965 [Candidatus Dormibacteraeota bacterium]|nr:hypothetical protein [Candidatus Dormibacteraeota bacterium]